MGLATQAASGAGLCEGRSAVVQQAPGDGRSPRQGRFGPREPSPADRLGQRRPRGNDPGHVGGNCRLPSGPRRPRTRRGPPGGRLAASPPGLGEPGTGTPKSASRAGASVGAGGGPRTRPPLRQRRRAPCDRPGRAAGRSGRRPGRVKDLTPAFPGREEQVGNAAPFRGRSADRGSERPTSQSHITPRRSEDAAPGVRAAARRAGPGPGDTPPAGRGEQSSFTRPHLGGGGDAPVRRQPRRSGCSRRALPVWRAGRQRCLAAIRLGRRQASRSTWPG
jgi:hypothetical protein